MKVKLKEKSVIVGAVQYNANREYVIKDEVGKELIDNGMAIEIKEVKVKKETKEHKQNSKETKDEAK